MQIYTWDIWKKKTQGDREKDQKWDDLGGGGCWYAEDFTQEEQQVNGCLE